MTVRDTQQVILETIAYFDVFEYPLTPLEIKRFCYKPMSVFSLQSCIVELDQLVATGKLETRHGFYFLGRRAIVATRLRRYQESWNKFALRDGRLNSYR